MFKMRFKYVTKFANALLILEIASIFSCAHSPKTEILGAWRSNRELTLATFEQGQPVPDKFKEVLYAPDFFGSLIHIYYENEAISIFEGQCSKSAYIVVNEGENYVDIEAYDTFLEKTVVNRVYIQEDLM